MNRMTPPQAYTREVLAKAYSWLKDQNEETKAQAQTADALVSLYLQSLRHKREEKTAQFKTELKSMASDLPGQLELSPQATKKPELQPSTVKPQPQQPQQPSAPVAADRSTADESITAYRKVEFPPVPDKFKAPVEPTPEPQRAEPQKKQEPDPSIVATKSIQNLFPPGSFSKAFEDKEAETEKTGETYKEDPEILKLIDEVSEKLRIEDTKIVHKMLVSIGYEHLMSVFPKK
ncbi:MAG: hypothetical protein MK008_02725 [Bdellovibrionales bacterium]|nr:hypothetical protein [Bdellovibrionales bacterium]